jgi:uncharacterized protein (DUF2147 family)
MRGVVPDGDGRGSGAICDRFNGKTYDGRMSLAATDRLSVQPDLVLPFFGKTQIRTRLARPAVR